MRPRKMRMELEFAGQTAIQVYDGSSGWKLRPFLNRRVVEPYTAEELRIASTQADLDGPLVDYAAKGTRIELAGTEKVEDRDAYKLKLTMKSGQAIHVWIDAQTFLETQDRGAASAPGWCRPSRGSLLPRFRTVAGLQIPYLLETKVLSVGTTALGPQGPSVPMERAIINKVVVNPKLDEARFSKPQAEVASNAR